MTTSPSVEYVCEMLAQRVVLVLDAVRDLEAWQSEHPPQLAASTVHAAGADRKALRGVLKAKAEKLRARVTLLLDYVEQGSVVGLSELQINGLKQASTFLKQIVSPAQLEPLLFPGRAPIKKVPVSEVAREEENFLVTKPVADELERELEVLAFRLLSDGVSKNDLQRHPDWREAKARFLRANRYRASGSRRLKARTDLEEGIDFASVISRWNAHVDQWEAAIEVLRECLDAIQAAKNLPAILADQTSSSEVSWGHASRMDRNSAVGVPLLVEDSTKQRRESSPSAPCNVGGSVTRNRPLPGSMVEQLVSKRIREMRLQGKSLSEITRDKLAGSIAVSAGRVSGTNAWKALAAEKRQSKIKPQGRAGKQPVDFDQAVEEGNWAAVEEIQQREQRGRR